MKKITILCSLACSIILSACNSIQVTNLESSSNKVNYQNEEQQIEQNNQERLQANDAIPDPPDQIEMGERFLAKNLILDGGSGNIYMSVENAETFNKLSDAGITFEQCDELLDGMNYDSKTGEFIGNRKLIIVTFKVENVDAISREYAVEPDVYSEYDFRVDSFGGCTESLMIYFNQKGQISAHSYAFHLEPGETIEIKCGYLADLRNVSLNEIGFEIFNKNETVIDLNLGE